MTRRGTASIVASPVLVGAITTLVVIVSVFLAYNANQGLPFVPTYDLKAELPSGANLVRGNEVRVGGFRVGIIERLVPATVEEDGEQRSIAVLDMKLDKTVEPLATDTSVIVRQRSALGLKYLELQPGHEDTTFAAGDTIPLQNAGQIVEFDDFLNTFDDELRQNSRLALQGFGDALAGRGESLNVTIGELPQFFGSLTTVMKSLSETTTELDEFFKQIGAAARQVAPVARVQAALFTNMADTFEAFTRDPEALRQTIADTPETLDVAVRSFLVQEPFLNDFATVSRRLRPAARELPRSLPVTNSALALGRRVLPRTVSMNRRLETVFRALDDLAEDRQTKLALQDLDYTNDVLTPSVRFVAPYQTVCNYAVHFFHPLGEHISEQVAGGTTERIESSSDNRQQVNRLGSHENARPADTREDESPYDEDAYPLGGPTRPHAPVNTPAIADNGKADCILGQQGYIRGPLVRGGRYGPNEDGGRNVVGFDQLPGRMGPTFTGVPSLRKIDKGSPNSIRKAP